MYLERPLPMNVSTPWRGNGTWDDLKEPKKAGECRCFHGTCYRASNWIEVGSTRGFSRRGATYKANGLRKMVFVYELNRHAQRLLNAPESPVDAVGGQEVKMIDVERLLLQGEGGVPPCSENRKWQTDRWVIHSGASARADHPTSHHTPPPDSGEEPVSNRPLRKNCCAGECQVLETH